MLVQTFKERDIPLDASPALPYKQDVRATLLPTGSIHNGTTTHSVVVESTAERL